MSGAQTSSFPTENELLAPQYLGIAQQQQAIRNQLAPYQVQEAQQDVGAKDIEMAARVAGTLMDPTLYPTTEARAAAYPGLIAQAQAGGYLKNAPPVYPGDERAAAIARLGLPSTELYKLQQQQAGMNAIWPVPAPAPGAPPGTTTGGGTGTATTTQPIPPRGTGGPGASASLPPEYLPYVMEASRQYNIPPDLLIAQMRQESGFNAGITGRAGEIGLMQIMPATARGMGIEPATITGPDNARNNILAGARYLRERAGANADMDNPAVQAAALRAYNGGGDPNYVANVFRYRPSMSPTDPAQAVTTYQVGAPGTQVAGAPPTAPPAAPGGAPARFPPGTVQGAGPAAGSPPPVPAPVVPQPPPNQMAPGAQPGNPPAPAATAVPPDMPPPPNVQIPPRVPLPAAPLPVDPQTGLTQRDVADLTRMRQGLMFQPNGPQLLQAEIDRRTQRNIQLQQTYQAALEKQRSDEIAAQQLGLQGSEAQLKYWQAANPDLHFEMTADGIVATNPKTGQKVGETISVAPNMQSRGFQGTAIQDGDTWRQPKPGEQGTPGTWVYAGNRPVQFLPKETRPAAASFEQQQFDYREDRKLLPEIAAQGQNAQTAQVRLQTMLDLLPKISTGAGGYTRTQLANLAETAGFPGIAQALIANSANGDAAAAQEFGKLTLAAAGAAERGDLGSRGSLGALKLYQQNNPGLDLRPGANKAMIGMQLIAAQADTDYSQGALAWAKEHGTNFRAGTGDYRPLTEFDLQWQQQRNPQVYAAAMGALNGQDAATWAKGLSRDPGPNGAPSEYDRALAIVSRASPNAEVNTFEGRKVMQPVQRPPLSSFAR